MDNIWSDNELDLLFSNIQNSVINIVEEFTNCGYEARGIQILEKLSDIEEKLVEELVAEIEEDEVDDIAVRFVQVEDNSVSPPLNFYTYSESSEFVPSRTLVIPDCHDKPGQNKDRFEKASKLMVDVMPDRVVVMGDFTSLCSLSHWDKNKRLTIEGKRYKQDISSAKESINLLFGDLWELQRNQIAAGVEVYSPEIIWLLGNHEEWAKQYVVYNPAMSGYLDIIEDLELEKFCDKIVPYKKYIEIEGAIFSHVPMNGGNVPVSGKHAIFRAQDQCSKSQVFAHTHRWEHISNQRHGDDDIIQTLSVGFFDFEKEAYCEDAPLGWWSGLTILDHWKPGRFDAQQVSLNRLMEMY